MDQLLLDKLVKQRAVMWAKSIRRHTVITEFVAGNDKSVKAATLSADRLDITARHFFGLLTEYRAALIGAKAIERSDGRRRRLDPDSDHLIRTVMDELGLSAKPHEIIRTVQQRRAAENLPLLVSRTIRLRIDDIAGRARITNLFHTDCDYLLDACSLNLWLTDDEGRKGVAHLTGLFEINDGSLLAYKLSHGSPSPDQLCRLVSRIDPMPRQERPPILGATKTLSIFRDDLQSVADSLTVTFKPDVSKVGLGFRSLVGGSIGKVECYKTLRGGLVPADPVPFRTAEEVIASLLARYLSA